MCIRDRSTTTTSSSPPASSSSSSSPWSRHDHYLETHIVHYGGTRVLTAMIAVPLLGAFVVAFLPRERPVLIRRLALGLSFVPLALTLVVWLRYSGGPLPQMIESVPWIPALGVGYKVGVDGFSLPLVALSALLFPVSMAYPLDLLGRERTYYGLFLFLEAASLGVFLALDLFLFFVFWDLSLVGMYVVIAIWGHGDAARSAIKFFIYTLTGSLALLLAIIGLYLSTSPHTFDMISIIQHPPLPGDGLRASLIFLGFVIAFVIKSPLVPLHTCLLYTSDAADDLLCVDLGGRRNIKKKK